MKRIILSIAIAGIALTAAGKSEEAKPVRPNIIFILTDDVGLGDIGCCGGPFKTPSIDTLARTGIRFAQCYALPLCGPSRSLALTGRYPFRTGLLTNRNHDAIQPGKEIMIPTVMKKAGYATASVGKWGQMSFGPPEWGFDEYLVYQGSGKYWRSQLPSYTVNHKEVELPPGVHLPDRMHDFVVDFVTRHREEPFFLYYSMSHIHGKILPTPDSKPGADQRQLYADNVAYMDKLVGKLMAELDRLHLREKTLVIFTGDNGTARFGVGAATVNGRAISGMKGTMLEGGSRVPLIANWKGAAPEGRVLNDLVDFSDFFTTFADLARAKLPEGNTLDGHSFAPQLRGEKGTPRGWIYVQLGARWYTRDQGFKLTHAGELFDMKEAPFTETFVPAEKQDETAASARTRLQAVLDKLNPAGGKTAPDNGPGKGAKKKKKGKNRLFPNSGNATTETL